MFSTNGPAPPLWHNGPTPGQFYDFPAQKAVVSPRQITQSPLVTATSVVAVTYNNGVIIAGDTLSSYGSLARYMNCPRIMKVNNNILLGAGGDYADYQYVKSIIEQKIVDEECSDDGSTLKPQSLYCWLTRIMYQRRSKFDPFWNNFVVGGIQEGKPFLGTVDKLGTAYVDKTICTGFGAHIATPMLRDALEKNPNLNKEEAIAVVSKCLEVLHYRDARSHNKYQIGIIDLNEGVEIRGPLQLNLDWSIANLIEMH